MPEPRASETARPERAASFARVGARLPGSRTDGRRARRGAFAENVSEVVAARLRHMGVDRVCGTPGLAVDPLIGALREAPTAPGFVQARGEESAALMACAQAKLTGGLGCCVAPPGAGVLRLLGGLYDAAADRAPVLALVGADPAARHIGGHAVRHLAEVCVYCEEVSGPELMDDALHRAVRAALTDRGVAGLVVPRPVLAAAAPGTPPAARPVPPPPRPPAEEDLRRAADVLDGAGKALVVGNAGRPASRQVVEVARLLGAGAATTALARDALPDDLPYLAGVAGPLGSEAAATLLRECDTLLLAGAEDPDPAVRPGPGRCRIVTVDREPDDCPLEAGHRPYG
ncbi:hypothetical protein GCM10010345_62260 [Streptomyces canarius]|uniref:Thiamine pyrophosphate enzyme N-terminal TPP-binding domain-containing protein n=1 Tax=Streptomyces canarius TaxID=285453 RepID=A0ABQ3CYT0_9ACTN|nr:hypothetical protein GCM10010345_62260 [Streptomyces canarius]